MKKLFILALALCLMGCGNANANTSEEDIYRGGFVVFVDGEVIDKYLEDSNGVALGGIPRYDRYDYGHLIVYTVDHPIYGEKTFDVIVDEYVYNYYEIGDIITFGIEG